MNGINVTFENTQSRGEFSQPNTTPCPLKLPNHTENTDCKYEINNSRCLEFIVLFVCCITIPIE